jgi:hypothetical protein
MTSDSANSRLDKVLADSTPLYAVLGLGDLAVERIREARAKLDAAALREQAQAKLRARMDAVQADVKTAPEQVMDLPVRVQAAVADAVGTTVMLYADFANRGRQLVTRVRHQQSAQDLEDEVETTVSTNEAATPTAEKSPKETDKSAKATEKSAKPTARTAKPKADSGRSSAKRGTSNTRKSTAAAKQESDDAAGKVDD